MADAAASSLCGASIVVVESSDAYTFGIISALKDDTSSPDEKPVMMCLRSSSVSRSATAALNCF